MRMRSKSVLMENPQFDPSNPDSTAKILA